MLGKGDGPYETRLCKGADTDKGNTARQKGLVKGDYFVKTSSGAVGP